MKKKGFTLIELLAVIVVLAIIALIATPIVMNTIKKSQKGAAERSADNYIEAVETAVATSRLDSDGVQDGTYTIGSDGNLTGTGLPNGKLTIEMSGNKPTGGTITIKDGQVTTDSKMTVGSYEVAYNPVNKKYEATEKESTTTEVLCKANTTKATALVHDGENSPSEESSYIRQEVGLLASESGAYTPGVTYTCELGDGESNTFYVLEENGDNVSLIAEFNLGDAVAWSEDGSNHKDEDVSKQAVTAKAALKERTSGWTKLDEAQITLPSAYQLVAATGKNFNGEAFSSLPTWVYGNVNENNIYWTSTPNEKDGWGIQAFAVSYDGGFGATSVVSSLEIRPVITISKSQLG